MICYKKMPVSEEKYKQIVVQMMILIIFVVY